MKKKEEPYRDEVIFDENPRNLYPEAEYISEEDSKESKEEKIISDAAKKYVWKFLN